MSNVIKFLVFIIYTTSIFFLPNNPLILLFFILNFVIILIKRLSIKKILRKNLVVLPFILFTFVINCILDDVVNAIWIGIKLFLVCNITIIYSETTSVGRNSKYYKSIMLSIKDIWHKYRRY